MLRTIDLRGRALSTPELLAAVPRATAARDEALTVAARIVHDVAARGEEALREQAAQFDNVQGHDIRVPQHHLDDALDGLDPAVRAALEEAIRRVREASAAQIPPVRVTELGAGARVEQRWRPAERVGVYVPGGKAVYPSSVVMNVVPAQVAGVADVVLASPPQAEFAGRVHPVILAAARLLGIDPDAALLAVLIGADHVDRGYGTDAVRLLTDFGFMELGLHRIELRVFAYNERARAVYRKLGYTEEGTRRAVAFHHGEFLDEVIMSVLAEEWVRSTRQN